MTQDPQQACAYLLARAGTVSGLQVLSTTWKSTEGTVSHWKYVVDDVTVYLDMYRADLRSHGEDDAFSELLAAWARSTD